MIYYWFGKRVDDMDRDELLAAFKGLAEYHNATLRINDLDRKMQRAFAELGYGRAA